MVNGDNIKDALQTVSDKFAEYFIKGIAESKIIVDDTLSYNNGINVPGYTVTVENQGQDWKMMYDK